MVADIDQASAAETAALIATAGERVAWVKADSSFWAWQPTDSQAQSP